MKSISTYFLGLFFLFSFVSCRVAQDDQSLVLQSQSGQFSEFPQFEQRFVLKEHQGSTFLTFMREKVKPALDRVATDGYLITNGAQVEKTYESSFTKIKKRVDGPWGGLDAVKNVASKLEGKNVNLASLPNEVRGVGGKDIFNLSTFLGLASGGGVALKFANGNFGLNVHYDVTNQKSGRSFGVGPTRGANDASDKDYLQGLAAYSKSEFENLDEFYSTLVHVLFDNDPTDYLTIKPEGQTILTDFLAVYTAEQVRNLMDGNVKPHWDAALLEVTLLAGFHAGQSDFKLFYLKPGSKAATWTSQTLRQTNCKISESSKPASLVDYWQFSRNISDPKNCRRSGINITKNEFRTLGKKITEYLKSKHKAEYDSIYSSLGSQKSQDNIYFALSQFLIREDAPRNFSSAQVKKIASAWVKALTTISKEANLITSFIESGNLPDETPNEPEEVIQDTPPEDI